MLSKWLIGLIALLIAAGVWMGINPSYEKSLESKVFFAMGKYEDAYKLAKEAFELDPYNRMASTVMTQSQTALLFVRYNDQARQYKERIAQIADQKNITEAERAKIRMMAAIMIDSFRTIAPTVVTDEALVREARSHYEQFKKLHDELAASK